MANSFVKIYLHIVFAVKNRVAAIPPTKEKDLHNYIVGIIKKQGHYPVCVGGTDTHVHILLSYENLQQTIPDLIRNIKGASSKHANDTRMIKCRFSWQTGYACIGCSHSHVPAVRAYIENQHQHHHGITLEDEVKRMLDKVGLTYDERYIVKCDD